MRKLKLTLSKREWAKRANPCVPWWLFEIYWKFAHVRWRLSLSAVYVTHAVYFPVNAAYFASKHLKFDSSYSNYRMKGLSCWHVITRTQLSSFLFPLEALSCKLVEQGWSLLNMRQTEKYGKASRQDLPELFYSIFLLAREKKLRQSSVWTTEWADKHPFLAVHQQDRFSCLCQRIIWSKIWPSVSNVHSFVR